MIGDVEDKIRLFAAAAMFAERELDKIEQGMHIDLGRVSTRDADKDESYYPQFEERLRKQAALMSSHYELFYCLETSIRVLIAETLKAQHGDSWWANCCPPSIKTNVAGNIQRELDSGFTLRSEQEIDYTTFGELGEIVRTNWICFQGMFSSEKAFSKIMTSLNVLRGPIAHCCILAEDEVMRLKLAVRDWFRLME